MSNQNASHWKVIKLLGLMFKINKNGLKLKEYVDSDFVGNSDNEKFTSTYFYVTSNTCISWKS